MNSTSDATRSIFITGLKNAHALEAQATQIIGRQLDRLENYPEVAERLRLHLDETKQHQRRLEEILGSLKEDHSTIKDIAAGFMGNIAALGHTPAGDEILKNSFANLAFENYEIAAYTSLIAVGEATGNASALAPLRQTLDEEERMAAWVKEHLREVTQRFLQLTAQGAKADR